MSEKDRKLKALDELIELANGGQIKGNGKFPAISPDIAVCQTPQDVLEFAESRGLMIADVKFTDLFGRWHHFSMPIQYVTEEIFEEGLGFDGSSIRAFQDIHESDMILFPDPASAVVDPVLDIPTLNLTCNIHDPITGEPYNKDVRYIAQKAESFLASEGIADVSYWGPEAEFFVFDGVSFDYQTRGAHFTIESDMGSWEARREFSQHSAPLEVELRHLVEHVVTKLDHLAGLPRHVDLLGVVGDVAEIPAEGQRGLEVARRARVAVDGAPQFAVEEGLVVIRAPVLVLGTHEAQADDRQPAAATDASAQGADPLRPQSMHS